MARVYKNGVRIPNDQVTYKDLCDIGTYVSNEDPHLRLPDEVHEEALESIKKINEFCKPMGNEKHEADSSRSLPRLVRHLDAGGQIGASTGQNVYRVKEGEYFLSCDTPGCCDDFMNLDGVMGLISDVGMEWECLPN